MPMRVASTQDWRPSQRAASSWSSDSRMPRWYCVTLRNAPPRGAAVVDADDDVAVLRQHLVPQVVGAAVRVEDLRRGRSAVNEHQHGVPPRAVEVRRGK